MLAEATQQIVSVNVTGRAFCSCRNQGVTEPSRIAFYTRAMEQAVLALLSEAADPIGRLEVVLTEQQVLLEAALAAAAAGCNHLADAEPTAARAVPPHQAAVAADPDPQPATPDGADAPGDDDAAAARGVLGGQSGMLQVKTMEEKLQDARQPLHKLLREDCVTLGLIDAQRAEQLVCSLAGRTREAAEADIVAELRNNLHQQLRTYIRKHKGGPWASHKAQEDLRLDIVATRTVHSLLMLARQVLREREQWEANKPPGGVRSLLGGKLRFGFNRRG